MPTEKFLNNLIVNKVDNSDTYKAMQTAGLVNEDEIYLIENPTANSIIEVNKGLEQKFWRGTKAEYDAITEKADDTMYIVTDEDGSTVIDHPNADWNDIDESSDAYILNKPFGPMKDWNVVFDEWGVAFEEDTTYSGVYVFSTDDAITGLPHPEAVKVTFDDTLYECSYLNTDSLPSIRFGNRSIIDDTAEDTGEPFYITSWIDAGAIDFGTEIYTKETDEEHSITIEFFQEYTKLLTHNYIDMADAVENYNYSPVSSHVVKKYVDDAIGAAISASY